jgi:hypothetical protein
MEAYTKEIEAQNEHLRAKLAEAQMLIDWRDQCRKRRLQFHYEFTACINTSDTANPGGMASTQSVSWFISRSLMKCILRSIKSHPKQLFDFAGFRHLRDQPIVYYMFYMKVGRFNEFVKALGEPDPTVEVLVSSHMIYETHL